MERTLAPHDRRSFQVTLTEEGRAVIDESLTEHAGNLGRLVAGLTDEQRENLDQSPRTLLRASARHRHGRSSREVLVLLHVGALISLEALTSASSGSLS